MPQRPLSLVLGFDTLSVADFTSCSSITVEDGVATLKLRCRADVAAGVYSGVVLGDGLTSRLFAVDGPQTQDIPGAKPKGCQHTKYNRAAVTKPRTYGKAVVHADELTCLHCGEAVYQIYTTGGHYDGMVWNHKDHDAAKSRFDNMCRLHTRKPATKPQVA